LPNIAKCYLYLHWKDDTNLKLKLYNDLHINSSVWILKYITVGLMVLSALKSVAWENTFVLSKLDQVIKQKATFTRQKEEKITGIKNQKANARSLFEQYRINRLLYKEYLKFRIDSAVAYANQNLDIAKSLNRNDLAVMAKLDLANLYFPLNKFLEADEILKSLTPKSLSKSQLAAYYSAKAEFYRHYLANNENDEFQDRINKYQDSLIKILNPNSIDYKVTVAVRNIYSGHEPEAEIFLLKILKTTDTATADYAMITYLLGLDYTRQHKNNAAIGYYAQSAALDVRFAIKDNASMQELALLLYATGDIDHAYLCAQSAIDDALFCNAKFRTLHMSQFYAIINTAYLNKEAKQTSQLKSYLLLISILSLFLVAVVIYVYRQIVRESRIKKELDITTRQLSDLNQTLINTNFRLNEANSQLLEANKIKEVYIAQFFDLCSAYINKLENFRKTMNKKASEKHLDELLKILRSTSMINGEVDELYKIFDNIFLSLYPTFIFEFNSLLLPEHTITVKAGEVLNTELRTYALIRLGITNSAQIAAFLRLSLSTIYNYRTGARNKALVARDCFEERVMKIGLIV
jgi:hypothetical protein